MQEFMDSLIILLLILLRIGLPLGLTLLVGRWLERKLRLPTDEERPHVGTRLVRSDRSMRVNPLHCWDIAHCTPTERAQCAAYRRPDLPCWLAIQVEGSKVRQECFTCELYSPQEIAA